MGDEAEDILRSFALSEEDGKKYDTVKGRFDSHFVKRRNIIFERTKFNMRRQQDGEPVDAFITALYGLAEHCGYGHAAPRRDDSRSNRRGDPKRSAVREAAAKGRPNSRANRHRGQAV